jgi:sigma-B regulation protein RsbU (phosphoserine phosphatase)
VLLVFSDGITEALSKDGDEFGEERLLSCVQANHKLAAAALLECVVDAVHQFCAGAVQSDDLTALVLRYLGK